MRRRDYVRVRGDRSQVTGHRGRGTIVSPHLSRSFASIKMSGSNFRTLDVWQKARILARDIYIATRAFPREELFGLTQQIRRAVVSIPSNIAEGFGRQSRPDLLKFLRISRGSLNETATQIELAVGLGMLTLDDTIRSLLAEVDRVLQGLIRSLERKR